MSLGLAAARAPRYADATMAGRQTGSLLLFILALAVTDAGVVFALEIWQPASGKASSPAVRQGSEPEPQPPSSDSIASDSDHAYCQTRYHDRDVTPNWAVITYLDSGIDSQVTAAEIQSWFGDLAPQAVEMVALEHRNGRRRLAFQLASGKWPQWAIAARGAAGSQVCGRIRAALLARGVGRPAIVGDGDRSRYDFEFIFARRTKLWRSVVWLGTLDEIGSSGTLERMRHWLDGGGEIAAP